MSMQELFTAEEWQAIKTAPPLVGAYIVTAGGMGAFSILKEMGAVIGAMQEASKTGSGGELVQAIMAELQESGEANVDLSTEGEDLAAARAAMLDEIRTAVALAEKAGESATEYKAFLMQVADQVAKAAKEGGFLGFGGTLVSDEEKQALSDLSGVLGVPAP